MSLIVAGTDTGVGKTVASAVILARHGCRLPLAYWKPVASGAAEGLDSDFVRRVAGDRCDVLPERYAFAPPVSPHLAARLAGQEIKPEAILAALVEHGLAARQRSLVIEGIGGLLVPLTDSGYLFADLVRDMSLPCLVVARSTLGTINHTLLTLEALRRRSLEVAGVVLVGPPNAENHAAIERFGDAEVIGEIPLLKRLGPAAILRAARAFDRRARLRRYLA